MPVKKDAHGLEQCLEWEGTRWSDVGVTVPCGSSVSSVSDSDQPEPTRFDAPSASELKALKAAAKAKAEQVVPFCPTGFHQGKWKDTKGDYRYYCKFGPANGKDSQSSEQCLEWEGTHWNDTGATVSCISTVSNVSESEFKAAKKKEDKETGIVHLHLKVLKATWVTLYTTDDNGYRHTRSRPIQRLTAVSLESKGQSVFDILCYGTSWSIGVGSDTQMDSCPTLQVGETYLMDVNGRTLERDVPNTNKHAAWQVLELCNPAPSGCQQISTLRDRE
ncbi:MAG: hypothetical protein WCF22_10305 [Candidatus Sulfotelmatobacter sp.]